jgi:ribosome assembly protein RRB1
MPAKIRRGKVSRDEDSSAPDAKSHRTMTSAQRTASDGAKATLATRAVAEQEWEDLDSSDDGDDNDVDERFDEMNDGEIIDDGDDDDDEEESDSDEDEDDEDAEYNDFKKEGKKAVKFAEGTQQDQENAKAEEVITDDQAGAVWRSDKGDKLSEGQNLDYSNRAYDTFFQLKTEFPALSFDIMKDNDGMGRTKYPMSMMIVCGSQAPDAGSNQLYVMRVSNILRTRHDGEEEDEDEDDMFGADDSEEDDDEADEEVNGGEPVVSHQTVRHHGCVNRVRCNPNTPTMVAAWSESGMVQVFDLENEARMLADFSNWSAEQAKAWEKASQKKSALRFASSSSTHKTEGYALAWSTLNANTFASGDCNGQMFLWKPSEAGKWSVGGSTPVSQGRSVEEIQFSPTQAEVFIACRAGGDVEVWDGRQMAGSRLKWRADPTDINVASWNKAMPASHLLATGADSGIVSIWDLRYIKPGKTAPQPIQQLTFHQGNAISSVEFSEHNESVLSVTSADGQCTLWDLSLERDADEEREVMGELFDRGDIAQLPDQLMFQHQGLTNPKEAHFHSQIPGLVLTTDYNSVHIFKPRNWRSLMK